MMQYWFAMIWLGAVIIASILAGLRWPKEGAWIVRGIIYGIAMAVFIIMTVMSICIVVTRA